MTVDSNANSGLENALLEVLRHHVQGVVLVERALAHVRELKAAQLHGQDVEFSEMLPPGEYAFLGITEAATRYLREVGKPQSTPQILNGMMERGWTTKSARPVQAVYATLSNAVDRFEKVGRNASRETLWRLIGS